MLLSIGNMSEQSAKNASHRKTRLMWKQNWLFSAFSIAQKKIWSMTQKIHLFRLQQTIYGMRIIPSLNFQLLVSTSVSWFSFRNLPVSKGKCRGKSFFCLCISWYTCPWREFIRQIFLEINNLNPGPLQTHWKEEKGRKMRKGRVFSTIWKHQACGSSLQGDQLQLQAPGMRNSLSVVA